MIKRCIFFILIFFQITDSISQPTVFPVRLKWNPVAKIKVNETESIQLISFEGSTNLSKEYGVLPVWIQRFSMNPDLKKAEVILANPVYEQLLTGGVDSIRDLDKIGNHVRIDQSVEVDRKADYLIVSLLPFRRDTLTGKIEKLVSFDLQIQFSTGVPDFLNKSVKSYAEHSVLSQGTWYKLAVNSTGIFKISSSDLKTIGIDPASIDPRNVRIFGNGGGMLPESNALSRIDDLMENAIYISGEEDGIFNDGDFILFYGESPDSWKYNTSTQLFNHYKNVYSDYTYYFITVDNGSGKRVQNQSSSLETVTDFINRFNDFAFYEHDDLNLIKSGREWYDKEIFDITRSRSYSFNMPNIVNQVPVVLRADVAARSTLGPTSFTVTANEQQIMDMPLSATGSDWLSEYGKKLTKSGSFTAGGDVISVKLDFNKYSNEAIGYLNYLEVNVTRQLKMSGYQMAFRSILSGGKNKVCEYDIVTNGQPLMIWDVTDQSAIKSMVNSQSGNRFVFRQSKSDTVIHEFLAFDGGEYKSVISYSKVENQDLHGTGQVDYVIITNNAFIDQAKELARFHEERDNFSVLVTTPDKVYNEFSSGAQDITAIRDFMKMLYDRSTGGKETKYLLLFGDASYDYKDRIQDNTNYVPTFESLESLDPVDSYISDDYFVLLDAGEGQGASGALDMGVGRFPVKSVEEAQAAVYKVKHYASNSDTVKNDWRNVISFVADDWDSNLHLNQTEEMVEIIEKSHKEYNIDKIYLDSYQAIPTPGGLRNPAVNEAINKRIAKGTLMISYTGHGGTLGWANARVLEIPDIISWTNFDNMPAFVTATCSFGVFDDPEIVSAGELVFLNPNGGGIALFTTTRATFAGANSALTANLYNNAFTKINGEYPTMGDLILKAKNGTGGSANSRKFVLLGDPGLRLAYPQQKVFTTSINNNLITSTPDTIKALSEVTIAGEVRNDAGEMLQDFNGTVFPTVYDKASVITTLGNAGSPITTFDFRKNIIFKGKVDVVNGAFSFTFMVPKDIAYNFGIGKISYYARSTETDACGYNMNFIVGGYNQYSGSDDFGPEISLFMNDTNFRSGGITNQNPILLAILSDSSGINAVGNGIGHDITAILDENTQEAKIMNDYYMTDANTFRSGVVRYPFYKIKDGEHSISVKAWDVYNNSSQATINFLVTSSADFALQRLMNFPNPFRDHTTFSFEYNQTSTILNVEIRIYTLLGDVIKTINQPIYTDGYRSQLIEWDGTTDGGGKISSGTYIYSVKVMLPGGRTIRKSSKLVVLR